MHDGEDLGTTHKNMQQKKSNIGVFRVVTNDTTNKTSPEVHAMVRGER
jgi:hypothetical protein